MLISGTFGLAAYGKIRKAQGNKDTSMSAGLSGLPLLAGRASVTRCLSYVITLRLGKVK